MNLKVVLLIIYFYSISAISQDATSSYIQYKVNFVITEQIELEAEEKGITRDNIVISFIATENCEIDDFKIHRPAKLESFNIEIIKQKNKIIAQIKEHIKCNGKRVSYSFPFSLNFYN